MKNGVFGLLLLVCGFFQNGAAQAVAGDWFIVTASVPKYLYEGDHVEIGVKLTNTTERERNGQLALQLTDATTNTSVDGWFQNVFPVQFFTVEARAFSEVFFPIEVPYLFKKSIHWRVVVAQQNSDTTLAEGSLQLFSTKTLVTQKMTLPLLQGTHPHRFEKLAQSDPATEHQLFAVQYFSNPMLKLAFALPNLPAGAEVAATTISYNFTAYTLAAHLTKTNPQLTDFIKKQNASALSGSSHFSQAANTASEISNEMGSFFDSTLLQQNQRSSFENLQKMQTAEGGFSWLAGGPPDVFITQIVLTNLAYVHTLEAVPVEKKAAFTSLVQKAFTYLDPIMISAYGKGVKTNYKQKNLTANSALRAYFYLHAKFKNSVTQANIQPLLLAFLNSASQNTTVFSPADQAMVASVYFLNDRPTEARNVLHRLKQHYAKKPSATTVESEFDWMDATTRLGMQIEAFQIIEKDSSVVADLQKRLLSETTYNGWQTPAATAAACYALLLINVAPHRNENLELRLGNTVLQNQVSGSKYGYLKKLFLPPFVQPELGTIEVMAPAGTGESSNKIELYWRYFTDSAAADTSKGVRIKKECFLVRGKKLQKLNTADVLHLQLGDTIRTRLTVQANRSFSYITLQVPVAAAFQFSHNSLGYLQQDTVGYYAEASVAGLLYHIPKLTAGATVFEHDEIAVRKGSFTSAQIEITFFNDPQIHKRAALTRIQVE